MDIQHLRGNYNLASLRRKDLNENPFDQFLNWFDDAIKASILEPNAMTLSTASKEGKPSSRIVLMKNFDKNGLTFYTNLQSRKAREIVDSSFVCVNFFWKELQRQIIIEGIAEKASRQESEAYFSSRPRGSQISAWASSQDQIIPSRQALEDAYAAAEARYLDQPVPLPEFWGGFRIIPNRFEFWQGRPDRLHDRFQYTPSPSGWSIDRLSP